ncbi:hypothetical protein X975_03200, partial [Stegodyphus mimosarum]
MSRLYARVPRVCVPLSVQSRGERLQGCREHVNWNVSDWGNVMFTDESRFALEPDDKRDRHINLLLISDDEKRHYCLIKNMSRFLTGLTKHNCATFCCEYCLHRFKMKKTLDAHIKDCQVRGPQKIKMHKDKLVKFGRAQFQLPVPYVIYADFECILVKHATCFPDPSRSSTTPINNHIASGYCYTIIGPNGEFYKAPVNYLGRDAVDHFLAALIREEGNVTELLKTNETMIFTKEDQTMYEAATHYHICGQSLKGDKVRDHNHLTGQYRGAVHNSFNLNFKHGNYIPVVFHNLRGYDAYLIMQGFGKIKGKTMTCMPNNSKKSISFSLGNLRFIDSLQFLNASLENLVANLEKDEFRLTRLILERKRIFCLEKHIKPKYGAKATLLFSDTDSLCYVVETKDIYADMKKDLHLFDTSDYPQDHPLFSVINKKVLGKMKDELAGDIAQEFVGLKPKI